MSDFSAIHTATMGNEGNYANNPADVGGETYKGIARKYWPKWQGWKLIDGVKALLTAQPYYGTDAYRNWVKHLNLKLSELIQLQRLVVSFYETNFWRANRLDQITNSQVAAWIYDHVVNAGARGVMWAQLAARVTPDGSVGPATLAAINGADPAVLLERMEDIAGAFRLDKAHDNPSQIQFLVGWLRRDGQPEEVIALVRQAAADGRLDDSEVARIKTAMDAA